MYNIPINSIYSKQTPAFGGINLKKTNPMSNKEIFEKLTEAILENLAQSVEKDVPKQGHFDAKEHFFEIPGTKNEACFIVKHNSTAPSNERTLEIGVKRTGSDLMVSNLLLTKASNEEIVDYLKNAKTEDVENIINNLSYSVDRKFL